MKYFHFPVIALVAMVVASCATTKYVSKPDFQAINDVAVFTPFTYITWQESKNDVQYSDSLSSVCAQLITKTIQRSSLPTGDVVDIEFSDDMVYQSALASLRGINAKKAGEASVPEPLLRLLRDSGQRYGVFVFSNGFMRSDKDFAKAAGAGAAVGVLTAVLTMGAATTFTVPYKYSFKVWTAVVDSATGRIVFYNTDVFEDGNPTREEHVRKIIELLFNDFGKQKSVSSRH